MAAGPLEASITAKLTESLAPERLEVINESHLHAGHQGGAMDGSGETHFRVRVVSPKFAGMGRIDRHRTINQALADELAGAAELVMNKLDARPVVLIRGYKSPTGSRHGAGRDLVLDPSRDLFR